MEEKYTLYMHISPSTKYYIGITKLDVDKRWKNGKGYKTNKYFYRAIQKYGWENFEHIILFEDLSKDEAENLEIYYIQKYNSTDNNYGYNKAPGGRLSPPVTDEAKLKMSLNHADFKFGKSPKSKKVYKYEKMSGDFIEEYDSVSLASVENGISQESISGVARGDELTAGGFRWSYEKKDSLGAFNHINKSAIKVYQYDLDGNYLSCCNSLSEAKYKYGALLFTRSFEKFEIIKSHGYLWSLKRVDKLGHYDNKGNKKIKQLLNGEIIAIHNSIAEATKATGIKTISQAVRGVQKHAGGYEWEYC